MYFRSVLIDANSKIEGLSVISEPHSIKLFLDWLKNFEHKKLNQKTKLKLIKWKKISSFILLY
jgi:hypothetical protein